MEVQSFNAELAIANLQFKRLFSNIKIKRTSRDNKKEKIITVPCLLENRSRILKNWENSEKQAIYKLPLISINRTGYSRNPDRLNNLHNEVKYEVNSKLRKEDLLTPIPIDISYDVTIMAKYNVDIDQIASNFMVFFNNDLYVQCMHPKYEGLLINNQVVMQDSITEEHPSEIDGSADDFIISTFQFVFKTYLFGGNQKSKLVPQQIVSSYISNIISHDIHVLNPNEIDDFQKEHPNQSVSVDLTSMVNMELTTLVDNPDISSYIYEGFTPIIKKIYMGFYPVPYLCTDFIKYMNDVDQYDLSVQPYYVDRMIWTIKDAPNISSEY